VSVSPEVSPPPQSVPVSPETSPLPQAAPVAEDAPKMKTTDVVTPLAPPVPVSLAPGITSATAEPLAAAAALVPASGTADANLAAPAAAPAAAAVPEAPPPAPVREGPPLRITFTGDAWVQVRDHSGKLIFTRTGVKGRSFGVPGEPPFSLEIKNADKVKLVFMDEPVSLQNPGKGGVVRLKLQ